MDYMTEVRKKWYRAQRDVDQLSERDRGLLLFITLILLFAVWYFIPNYLQNRFILSTEQQTSAIQAQIAETQKQKTQIENLANTPDVQALMQKHKSLLEEMTHLDQKILSYSHRYISAKDLGKLLNDMTTKNNGVKIVDFSTVASAIPQTASQQPSQEASAGTQNTELVAVHEKIYYRLVLKGEYFAIMNYLQKLEELTWRLYWDQFEYTVIQYPQSLATITFYTLKPVAPMPTISAGSGK